MSALEADPAPAAVTSRVDATRPTILTILGKKGEGKSVLARRFWESWPGDRLVIDNNGSLADLDDTRPLAKDGEGVPSRWPTTPAELLGEGRRRTSLRYVPDPGSTTYLDDLDRAAGLVYQHQNALLWCDEMGDIARVHKVGPWMRRILHQGRHRRVSALFCGPRPIDVDPLVLAQADFVYVFKLPNPRDRERVAGVIGVPPAELDQAVHELGEHEYLRFDGVELVAFPKLPPGRVRIPGG